MPKPKKAAFVGFARDSAEHMRHVLANVHSYSECFEQSAFIFIENDSRDATKLLLRDHVGRTKNAELIELDGLSFQLKQRTIRLAYLRNLAVDKLKQLYFDFDVAFFLDADDANAFWLPEQKSMLLGALDFLERNERCAAVFPNQLGIYYDMWALRHSSLCPNDIWEEVADFALIHNASDDVAFENAFKKRALQIDPNHEPIRVDSAFGGLGIYKISSILKNEGKYVGQKLKLLSSSTKKKKKVGWQTCEHVSFNRGFIANGEELYIVPRFLNGLTYGLSSPARAWRNLIFEIGHDSMCPCGSDKTFAQCCGSHDAPSTPR